MEDKAFLKRFQQHLYEKQERLRTGRQLNGERIRRFFDENFFAESAIAMSRKTTTRINQTVQIISWNCCNNYSLILTCRYRTRPPKKWRIERMQFRIQSISIRNWTKAAHFTLQGMLVLVLVLEDSVRTNFKSLYLWPSP